MSVFAWIQGIPSFYWVPIILFICTLFLYVIKQFILLSNYLNKPTLEIIDDGKYNQIIQVYCNGKMKEYIMHRIGIRNNSKQIVNNISVNTNLIDINNVPVKTTTADTSSINFNLHPKEIKIVDLFFQEVGKIKSTDIIIVINIPN